MEAVFSRKVKITDAVGRHRYLIGDHQEEVVFAKSMMEWSWEVHSSFEKSHQRDDQKNLEALELVVALPNDLYGKSDEIEEICDEIVDQTIGDGHDFEYAVHWNENRTNLHVHIMFSERENVTEAVQPKTYKKDIWQDRDTGKLAKAGSPNAVLVHRKGEVQKDKDGNVRYSEDIFKPKDKRYKAKSWLDDNNRAIQQIYHEHGYEIDIHDSKESPCLPQLKLHKGASEDYLEHAKAWNEAVTTYNKEVKEIVKLEPKRLPQMMDVKKEILERVRQENRKEKRISDKAIELVRKVGQKLHEIGEKIKDKLEDLARPKVPENAQKPPKEPTYQQPKERNYQKVLVYEDKIEKKTTKDGRDYYRIHLPSYGTAEKAWVNVTDVPEPSKDYGGLVEVSLRKDVQYNVHYIKDGKHHKEYANSNTAVIAPLKEATDWTVKWHEDMKKKSEEKNYTIIEVPTITLYKDDDKNYLTVPIAGGGDEQSCTVELEDWQIEYGDEVVSKIKVKNGLINSIYEDFSPRKGWQRHDYQLDLREFVDDFDNVIRCVAQAADHGLDIDFFNTREINEMAGGDWDIRPYLKPEEAENEHEREISDDWGPSL